MRPAPTTSKSPYNFEIVLLDHGLYFDLSPQLRVNYSKLWLSLMQSASPSTTADRQKYAELVGNIGSDLVRTDVLLPVPHVLNVTSVSCF
jgi:aarF domain-containing kinase